MIDSSRPPWPPHPALFLDVDGTLLEIAERPERVVPSPRLLKLLPMLPAVTGQAVALISGRRIADLDRVLTPHRFSAAGLHGLERRRDGGSIVAVGTREQLDAARGLLKAFAAPYAGLWVEDKELALAVHYRERPDLEPTVLAFAGELEAALDSGLEVLRGHSVIEIKSRAADKGAAIRAFMAAAPFEGRTPVFVGDDVTDEAGFRFVNGQRGISIKVGRGNTLADWRLENVVAVIRWLESAIEGHLARSGA